MSDRPNNQTTPAMGLLLGILLGPVISAPIAALVILMLYTSTNYCELASAPPPAFSWWQWPWDWPGVRLVHLIADWPGLWCSRFDLFGNLPRAAVATAINVTVALLPLLVPLSVFQATLWVSQAARQNGGKT